MSTADRLRLVLRATWVTAALAMLFAICLPLRGLDLALERLAGRPVSRLGNRIVRLWAAQALPSLGLSYVQRGRPMRGGGAFVANHSSWIDIVALQRAAGPFLVSKAEVRDWPGVGHIGRAIGTMFIDRRPGEAKRQEAELLARLARGDQMALFPEGTSTDGMRMLPFKSTLFGAFFAPGLRQGIAVQPVTSAYRGRAGMPPSFYGWWGEMDFASHARDVLGRSTGGVVELTFHPPLPLADYSDRKALAQAADAAVRAGLGSPSEAAGGRERAWESASARNPAPQARCIAASAGPAQRPQAARCRSAIQRLVPRSSPR
jgi:1-acyl-sn-glycerol-3-phosphate acyltransferase